MENHIVTTEKIYKNRIEVKFQSTDEKPLSGFQLPEFMNNLSKYYYKLDLINEISRYINEGSEVKNIFIISDSFEVNNQYKHLRKCKDINLDKPIDVEKLYNLGKPISMFPNDKFIRINLVFKLYEKIYTYFNKNKIDKLPKKYLSTYINSDFNDTLNKIENDCNIIINNQLSEEDDILDKTNQIKKYIKEVDGEYKAYLTDSQRINMFEDLISKTESEITEEQKIEYRDIEKKYFRKFFRYLKTLDRPIVGIYDESSNSINILKSEYMFNDRESESFLDYKDYSHNSPFIITLVAGFALVEIVYIVWKSLKENKTIISKEEENETLEEENRKEINDMLEEIANSDELNQNKNVKNNYVKEKLSIVKEKTQKSSKNVLKRYKVANNKMIINLDDYKQRKIQIEKEKNQQHK